jgi:phosphate transport system protein
LPLDLPDSLVQSLKRLGDLVQKQLKDVIDSYVNKSLDKSLAVWKGDEKVDDLTHLAMNNVMDFLSKDKKNLAFSTHLIFVTKNLERAGDHITNIAESVYYLIKGEYLKGHRPKGKDTSV